MSEPKLISPLLDNFAMGGPISDHHGIQCCPAMENNTDDKYIVKIISVPASSAKLDALLLTGAYADEESALAYFKGLANDVIEEVEILNKLSEMEGFLPYKGSQLITKDSGKGFDVYLLSPYKRSLEKHFKRHSMTHLDALNLGLDLCAALSVCRRSGFLYVALKPSNVFVTGDRLYRIGDLGFIRLDSLKYASLPDKYYSQYTPPEIRDAFSALNSTMDIYAAGLILYQAYNNGELPFNDQLSPGDAIPAPLYADYEMSEIILKACAPDPADRWQDPMQMGQAIINYMQRNGASDTPIVTNVPNEPVQEPVKKAEETENIISDDSSNTYPEAETNLDSFENPSPETEESPVDDLIEEYLDEDVTEIVEESPQEFVEDEFGNLSFLSDFSYTDDPTDEEVDYASVSDEVSEILNQADELAALSVPEPVVVPEYVDIPTPEPVEEIESDDNAQNEEMETTVEIKDSDSLSSAEESSDSSDEDFDEAEDHAPVKKKRHWLRNSLLVLLLLALLAGGYYYYKHFYLLPIEGLVLDGNKDSLTVRVDSEIDESLLLVICSDTYGNQTASPVVDGIASFENLIPDTAYTIKIVANGFHRLVGDTATAYSTPIQTNIVQFDAVTGSTDGSVILSFTIEGPDCPEWTVLYWSDGEEERSATFDSHVVTITDLTVGKDYTFRLQPAQELYITGQNEISYTASDVIYAENLTIDSCTDNMLTASWSAPEGKNVPSWSVHCFNESFSSTIITPDTFVTFEGLDHTAEYTVEVKASGMSASQVVSIPKNSVTATNFKIDTDDPTTLTFNWDTTIEIPEDGWVMRYKIAGVDKEELITCTENSAVISPIVPNATYFVQLEDVNGNVLLNSRKEITTGEAIPFDWNFDGYEVHQDDLIFNMCKTPDKENWTVNDLKDEDYTTEFTVGDPASFLVKITKRYSASSENVSVLYVIRNQDGHPIQTALTNSAWKDMWYRNYCELNIPVMPTTAGSYTMEVYFNGGIVAIQDFSIAN